MFKGIGTQSECPKEAYKDVETARRGIYTRVTAAYLIDEVTSICAKRLTLIKVLGRSSSDSAPLTGY